ncbi:MAG: IS66 family insertion sequence element accessory protein TnpB [Litorilituus sp.]|nr:IS66 family insertion sequence element accessory protein TnpB [Litorilituus sp.]
MRKFRSPNHWQQILAEQQKSGLTISAFCRQHNISTSGFYTQRQKQSVVTASTSAFVSTKVTKQTSTEVHRDVKQRIVLEPSAARLTLPAETPANYLITLLNGLSA